MNPTKASSILLLSVLFAFVGGYTKPSCVSAKALAIQDQNKHGTTATPKPQGKIKKSQRVTELIQKLNADKTDIFAFIWDLPESHIRTTRIGDNEKPIDAKAQVILHEQGRAKGCLDQDNAPKPLLELKDKTVLDEPTFKTFIALLDNYTAVEKKPELTFAQSGDQRWVEVDTFLDAVFDSVPVQVAVAHIKNDLSPESSLAEIRKMTRKMWFEPYTNRYRSDQPFCVGFEHVFVGEDESNATGAPNCDDRVGGYHSWIKFYLEQQAGKVNYLGYDYPEGNVADALEDHKVATMLMRWSPDVKNDGGHGHDLLKKPGGFFIGTRPELEIAFGMLAMYAQKADKYDNVSGKENHHRVKLGDNFYDLVMHPESISRGKRGDHIRTLYPKFRGKQIPNSPTKVKRETPTQPHNDAAIQITRALPNPDTEGDIGEWVEIKNSSAENIDLAKWELRDQSGRAKKLNGALKPGETLKVELERVDQNSMMLKNGDGWILLFENNNRRAGVRYTKPGSGKVIVFDAK